VRGGGSSILAGGRARVCRVLVHRPGRAGPWSGSCQGFVAAAWYCSITLAGI